MSRPIQGKKERMSFSRTKDQIFTFYNGIASWLSRRSPVVRQMFYGTMRVIFWVVYLLPGNSVRVTTIALSKHVGHPSPKTLYSAYITGFMRGIDRLERVRHGFGSEVDKLLSIPEQGRVNALLEKSGFILVMPHVHGSFAMVRGLSQSYDVMTLVRLTRNEKRAQAQRDLYSQVGCDFHDVRNGDSVSVARTLLRALKAGKIVIGLVDSIEYPQVLNDNPSGKMIAATAFGEDVKIITWPAMFGVKAGVPIVPATVEQAADEIRLILGRSITPTNDLAETTQNWLDGLQSLMRHYPQEWAFWLDKNWSQLLRKNPPE